MIIKQSVLNTFKRLNFDYQLYDQTPDSVEVSNRFGAGTCKTSELISECIELVYRISNDYEAGISDVNISDFDRLRYFVLEADKNAYYTCLD